MTETTIQTTKILIYASTVCIGLHIFEPMHFSRNITIAILIFFTVSAVLILLHLPHANYLPAVFGLAFFPVTMFRYMKLAFDSSAYIKANHPEFYKKYRTVTIGTNGNLVSIRAASKAEIEALDDALVLSFRNQIRNSDKLFGLIVGGFVVLGVLTVLVA